MKIKRLAHIGIAVKDVEQVAKVYTDFLGLQMTHTEPVGELLTGFIPVGQTNLELVMSTTEDGTIAKHIAKRGEGIQHIAFEVEDIDAACRELKEKGVPLTSDQPWDGAHGARVLFLHPKATHGVLIELCQYPDEH